MSIVELYYDAYLETLPDFFCSLLTTNDVVPLCVCTYLNMRAFTIRHTFALIRESCTGLIPSL